METVFPLRTAYRARMDHDGAHKLIYSLPEVVADLLRILAAGWADKLDFSTLERLSSDYIDEDHLKRIGDMLWRVRFREGALKDGSRPCLLMMIEFQSTVGPAMAERIRKYTSMLLGELERNGTAAREGGLPLVLAAVIYNGDRRWTAAGDAADLVARVPSGRAALALAAHQPQAYSLLPVRTDLDADAGPADDAVESRWPADNRVLATARLQRARSASDLLARLHEEMVRFPGVRNAAFRRALHAWARELWSHLTRGRSALPSFDALAQPERKEMTTFLEARAREWEAEWLAQGIEQGIERGIEQGRASERALLCRLAERRFGSETAGRLSALLAGLTSMEMLQVGDWVIECGTGAELLSRVGSAIGRDSNAGS